MPCPAVKYNCFLRPQWVPFSGLVCAAILWICMVSPGHAAFGLSTATDSYTVDTDSGLVFKVRRTDNGSSTQSAGDLMSLVFNGIDYQNPSRGTHINSGFDYLYDDISSVSVSATQIDPDTIRVTVRAGDLTHYYLARRGDPVIYMATYFTTEPSTLNLCRFIVRIPQALLPTGPIPSDIRGNTGAIEASDVFGMADGTTRSKHYSNMRLKDWSHIGATGPNVGVWIARSSHEGDSGGPFYRSLLNQTGSDQEITYILNYGQAQTEPYRTSILNGPYALVFTEGAPPGPLDTSWIANMGLIGFVGSDGRGGVECSGITGRDTRYEYTVGFANSRAQYWTGTDDIQGAFARQEMLPGTYSLKVYKGELAVHTTQVEITAGTNTLIPNITVTEDPNSLPPRWRIGNFDGTPREFLNGDKITVMHPSDVRMSDWNPGPFVVDNSSTATGIPCYQWKDVNGSQEIQFTLAAAHVRDSTVRVGITVAYSGARPKIDINNWSPSNPSPSTQPNSRTLTTGSYRGNNTVYTFSVPASALVAGVNIMRVYPISGSGGSGFLSPGYSLDCIDFLQGDPVQLPIPSAPLNLTATASNFNVTLQWSRSIRARFYELRRSAKPGGPYVTVADDLIHPSFVDTNAACGTCYYVVRAGNSSGTGADSEEVSAEAGIEITPTLIAAGAVWHYYDDFAPPNPEWSGIHYNPLSWQQGRARLGYGNNDEATVTRNNGQITTYLRRLFHIPDPSRVSRLNGRVTRDDAAIIYVNGTEIWRDPNIGPGNITHTSPALTALGGEDETEWLAWNLSSSVPTLLQPGWNVLAAEVHNHSTNSSDIGFNLELTADAIISQPPELTIERTRNTVVLTWPSDASYFKPFGALDVTPPIAWSPLTNTPVLSGSTFILRLPIAPETDQYFILH